jgi:hypothetical protein
MKRHHRPNFFFHDEFIDHAHAQGWGIFESGGYCQLQRIDDPEDGEPRFDDDFDAWLFVVLMAYVGDPTCRQGLLYIYRHSRQEYLDIFTYCVLGKDLAVCDPSPHCF